MAQVCVFFMRLTTFPYVCVLFMRIIPFSYVCIALFLCPPQNSVCIYSFILLYMSPTDPSTPQEKVELSEFEKLPDSKLRKLLQKQFAGFLDRFSCGGNGTKFSLTSYCGKSWLNTCLAIYFFCVMYFSRRTIEKENAGRRGSAQGAHCQTNRARQQAALWGKQLMYHVLSS